MGSEMCIRDSHMADTGLFEHIISHMFAVTKEEIYDVIDDGEKKWTAAMERLKFRLLKAGSATIDNEGINAFVAAVGHRAVAAASDNSTPMYKASEFRRLMLVSTYLLLVLL